jgi:hypothetical protein
VELVESLSIVRLSRIVAKCSESKNGNDGGMLKEKEGGCIKVRSIEENN